jgi:ninein
MLVSSLEAELSEVKIQTHIVEQENLLLKDELEKMKQVSCVPRRRVMEQHTPHVVFPATTHPLALGPVN